MKCVSPFTRRYIDMLGREQTCVCPCGKCIACLHNQQDSWAIRLGETNYHYRSFIYDTLTFSPSGISYRNITEHCYDLDKETGEMIFKDFPPEVLELLDRYKCVDPDTGETIYLAPVIDRSCIQGWLKRGRQLFYKLHKYRPKIKYFIVEEYGPKTSRPHFHLLMWGLSKVDYVRFFAKPWRRDYGFTKTKYIEGGSDKDRDCIGRYVSKYVSKGVFESPLVAAGLIPKPFRSISHGIGEEYLEKDCFKYFNTIIPDVLRSVSVDTKHMGGDAARTAFVRSAAKYFEDVTIPFEKFDRVLTTYYDRNGFPHALPRYYRAKLLGSHKPNLLSYAFQNHLLEVARVQFNTKIQRLANSMGHFYALRKDPKDTHAGLGVKLYDLLCFKLAADERIQARVEARRRFFKLKNHYGRAMNLQCAFAN